MIIKSIDRAGQQLESGRFEVSPLVVLNNLVPDIYGHAIRVSGYAKKIAQMIGLQDEHVKLIQQGGLLHDIGKICIPNEILYKTSCLIHSELKVIKTHPAIGASLLSKIFELPQLSILVLCHHERWDGNGYPYGIEKEDIPVGSRIIGVCDAYDAMASSRPYRKSLSLDQIIDELSKNAGSQFDPEIVELLIRLIIKE